MLLWEDTRNLESMVYEKRKEENVIVHKIVYLILWLCLSCGCQCAQDGFYKRENLLSFYSLIQWTFEN